MDGNFHYGEEFYDQIRDVIIYRASKVKTERIKGHGEIKNIRELHKKWEKSRIF